ncbi:MAG TPA: hypothetical protein VFA11_01490 [Acidimicrobiales bacterium]|nr:hypothetical protein [Acidimicrobiales bacterium]
MAERYVVLGLARPRAEWFTQLAQWATGGSLPVEFVKCLTAEELHARLQSNRPYSAVLLDETLPIVDRDLVAVGQSAGCAVVLVASGEASRRHWAELGADAVLRAPLDQGRLHEVLRAHARVLGPVTDPVDRSGERVVPPRGRLVAVCGPGGTGTSTIATCLAQGLGSATILVDLALHAEQAVLHGVLDPVGLQGLVEAHRRGGGDWSTLAPFVVEIRARGYHLLPGLARARAWSALRPHAFRSALDSLLRHYSHVVCDTDAEVEGERESGSVEVEDRNLMSRTALAGADVVVVVGSPGLKGTHSLVRLLADLVEFGVSPTRLLPVLNRAGRARRQSRSALQVLAPAGLERSPVLIGDRPAVEAAIRDGSTLPHALVEDLTRTVRQMLAELTAPERSDTPEPVTPGSLGSWAGEEVSLG